MPQALRAVPSGAISRRLFLAAGIGLPALVQAAAAQDGYPARPIKIVIGYSPGGLSDTMTRLIAEHMSRDLGQAVVVENRVGAATSIASAFVARSAPDGYTLLMGTTSLAINPALQPNLQPRDPQTELRPLGMAYDSPFVLIVRATLPVRSLDEFVAYARANPGALEMGSSGTGAVNHLLIEMLSRKAGISVVPIPYTGAAPTMIDLRGGAHRGDLRDADRCGPSDPGRYRLRHRGVLPQPGLHPAGYPRRGREGAGGLRNFLARAVCARWHPRRGGAGSDGRAGARRARP